MGHRSSFHDRASTDSAAARQQSICDEPLPSTSASAFTLPSQSSHPPRASSSPSSPSSSPQTVLQDGSHSYDFPSEVHGDQGVQQSDRSLFAVSRHSYDNHSNTSANRVNRRQSTDQFSLSNRDSVEMSALSDEEIGLIRDDEEAGLTAKERRQRARLRRQQRRELDSRIDTNISDDGKRAADRNVIRKLSINVVLILLWYFFSLSISVVSAMSIPIYPLYSVQSKRTEQVTDPLCSITNGCFLQTT